MVYTFYAFAYMRTQLRLQTSAKRDKATYRELFSLTNQMPELDRFYSTP